MIQLLTSVKIIDNSGALEAKCIKVLSPKNSKIAKIGDIILVSIQKTVLHNPTNAVKIRRGQLFKALVVRTKKEHSFLGTKWDHNAVVLIKKPDKGEDWLPIGSRFTGPISLPHLKNFQKVLAIAKVTI